MIKVFEKIKTHNKRFEFEMKNKIHKKQTILEQENLIISYSLKMVEIKNTVRESIKEAEKKRDFLLLRKKLRAYFLGNNLIEHLKLNFVEIHPMFLFNLKNNYPKLTPKEIDFLMLVKLNMSNNEIAKFLNFNYKSVVSKKYLLRKKMNLKSDVDMLNLLNEL